ncbi:HWE histidine kinase domain-containing protein [Erythrobacter sp.]|uniref:HWE histidine kinase domain-containing protein n=1 Tax=Erythrobacter sp. TaxID=1042 RepID=UPI002EBE0888|nr:HWE histidine kinase domain-containing protein [Erythrobacter sp.]
MTDSHDLTGTGKDHLALVLAVGDIGIWELDTNSKAAWRNARHDEIFGYATPLESWTYEQFLEHVLPEDRAAVNEKYGEALREERDWSFECRIIRADGVQRWINANGKPIRDAGGSVSTLIGHVIDITHTKRNEEHLRLVTNELNHRVRNMLAVMKAMIGLSAKTAQDVPSFARAVEGRVAALGRAHDLLANHGSDTIALRKVILNETEAFVCLGNRLSVTGADKLVLRQETAERLALVLHELMTNALKYGALSNETGRVEIEIESRSNCAVLHWRERGGPRVVRPKASGFGSTLLDRAFGGKGSVIVDYDQEGVQCRIEIPVSTPSVAPEKPTPAGLNDEENATKLIGKRVLVLEDEPLIAMSHEAALEQAGAIVFGSFSNCADALSALDKKSDGPDLAILDINLGEGNSGAVAERLKSNGVPFVFTTGYSENNELLGRYRDHLVVRKPAAESDLIASLSEAFTGHASER